jgi:hypothetical protein
MRFCRGHILSNAVCEAIDDRAGEVFGVAAQAISHQLLRFQSGAATSLKRIGVKLHPGMANETEFNLKARRQPRAMDRISMTVKRKTKTPPRRAAFCEI